MLITLQFSSTPQWGSSLIRKLTWSWASHVDFVLDDKTLFGALAVENGGGVQFHELHKLDYYTRVERYTIEAPDAVLDIAFSQDKKKYDWKGVFGFLFKKRKWQEDDRWFCSELVAYAFQEAGMPLIRDYSYRITPRDLLLSTLLTPVKVIK